MNRWGFRDRDYETPGKPADTHRIAFLGDSVTLGLGVAAEDVFVRRFEDAANGLGLGYTVQALNFSVDGYNTVQVNELLRTKVLPFAPDKVIYVLCLNDFDFADASGMKIRYFRKPKSFLAGSAGTNLPPANLSAARRERLSPLPLQQEQGSRLPEHSRHARPREAERHRLPCRRSADLSRPGARLRELPVAGDSQGDRHLPEQAGHTASRSARRIRRGAQAAGVLFARPLASECRGAPADRAQDAGRGDSPRWRSHRSGIGSHWKTRSAPIAGPPAGGWRGCYGFLLQYRCTGNSRCSRRSCAQRSASNTNPLACMHVKSWESRRTSFTSARALSTATHCSGLLHSRRRSSALTALTAASASLWHFACCQ